MYTMYCVDADICTCMTSIYDCTAAHMHSLVVHTVCACCMYYMHNIPSISLLPILYCKYDIETFAQSTMKPVSMRGFFLPVRPYHSHPRSYSFRNNPSHGCMQCPDDLKGITGSIHLLG